MWLLKTGQNLDGRLELVGFNGSDRPQYAILSHTWSKDEVSFADIQNQATIIGKKGYDKIRSTLAEAAKDGLEYAWVDTCCIDKSSSAELSEAINASKYCHFISASIVGLGPLTSRRASIVYSWYETASVCYAFLQDVDRSSGDPWRHQFRRSRWYRRGWTLQELLASRRIRFFDQQWAFLGDKSGLAVEVEVASGIPMRYLDGTYPISSASIAKRMSWASHRVTTRVEDRAYCMLGIFDVNMPMLYGEGNKAFLRLQEEIMRSTDDQTLFAWKDAERIPVDGTPHCGLLAPSPAAFASTGNVLPLARGTRLPGAQEHGSHAMTNRGLNVAFRVQRSGIREYLHDFETTRPLQDSEALAMLGCIVEGGPPYLALALTQTAESPDHFRRSRPAELFSLRFPLQSGCERSIFIRQTRSDITRTAPLFQSVMFEGWRWHNEQDLRPLLISPCLPDPVHNLETQAMIIDGFRSREWTQNRDGSPAVVVIPRGPRLLSACMSIRPRYAKSFILMIGSDELWRLAFDVCRDAGSKLEDKAPPASWKQAIPSTLRHRAMPGPLLPASSESEANALSMNWKHAVSSFQAHEDLPRSLLETFNPKAPGTRMEMDGFFVDVDTRPANGFEAFNVTLWRKH